MSPFVARKLKNSSEEHSKSRNSSLERKTSPMMVSPRLAWRQSVVAFTFSICLLIIIGNFGFGIDEHIDLGIKYDTSTGIFGMDFYVVLARPGKRTSKRRAKSNIVGKFQRVTKEDAKLWFVEKLGGSILN